MEWIFIIILDKHYFFRINKRNSIQFQGTQVKVISYFLFLFSHITGDDSDPLRNEKESANRGGKDVT
ncbi:hypothetical protein B9J09_05070 [Xylella fastidiosa subsp. pauca]|nr:hypothetical protein B9J09_05070 [Xylella fastidiosa subsp. pauca]AVI20602.1 hypothetical protein BCV75_04720 [Xylella fastidiosa]OJZ71567.1 hypothetical protein B375_0204925 [Xylella fastidiosa 6c]AVI22623.1 hypothetical protein BC375_04775 [Xylella fastidiosa]KIA57705.1 hypothetical protein RA12_08350 [Xylella fastidiosa]